MLQSVDVDSMLIVFWTLLVVGAPFILWEFYTRSTRYWKLVRQIPGPPGLPFFGNAIELSIPHPEVMKKMISWYERYKVNSLYKFIIGPHVYVLLVKASCVEPILSSSELIEKSRDYKLIMPWLGTGLLISTGPKWKSRRKMLTPAFHFRILEDFANVFNEHSKILVKQLKTKAGNQVFDIFPHITMLTLDVICETAMGRHLNAQNDADSDYVKALYKICEIIMTRMFAPWLQVDWLFNFFPLAREHNKCLKTVHEFTRKVIQERKEQFKKTKNSANKENQEDVLLGKKRRLAFLDLLLEASQDGKVLSDDDIQEEVDTFMFEGHDTTAAALSGVLYLLGHNPEHQLKVQEELDQVIGDDEDRYITIEDVSKLKYLECVIKESLRILPSVPLIGRKLTKDVVLENRLIPAGVIITITPFLIHRDPVAFPEPEKFDPDRFTLDNIANRNPYAYIPFSAGPRNCIGQKFAMLEMKIVLVHILMKFSVKSTQTMPELELVSDLILRPLNGYKMIMTLRK